MSELLDPFEVLRSVLAAQRALGRSFADAWELARCNAVGVAYTYGKTDGEAFRVALDGTRTVWEYTYERPKLPGYQYIDPYGERPMWAILESAH